MIEPSHAARAPTPRPEITALRLADARVAVRTDDREIVDWLVEALTPGFVAVEPGAGDVLVQLESPDKVTESPSSETYRSAELLPCFAFERGHIRLPGRAEGDRIVLEDPDWGSQITVTPGRVDVRPSGVGHSVRGAALRVVRELALAKLLGRGDRFQLHASAVTWAGRCLAFAGPRCAGKTTAAACITASTDAMLLANDRVLLGYGDRGWVATGIPTLVSVRPDTLMHLPEQFRTVPNVLSPASLTMAEYLVAGESNGYLGAQHNVYFTLPQFAHELGTKLVGSDPLACLAVIAVDPSIDEFEVEPMGPGEGAEALRSHSFGWPSEPCERTVFDRMVNGDDARFGSPPVHDLDDVTAVRLRVGRGFVSSPSAPGRLLRMLLQR